MHQWIGVTRGTSILPARTFSSIDIPFRETNMLTREKNKRENLLKTDFETLSKEKYIKKNPYRKGVVYFKRKKKGGQRKIPS